MISIHRTFWNNARKIKKIENLQRNRGDAFYTKWFVIRAVGKRRLGCGICKTFRNIFEISISFFQADPKSYQKRRIERWNMTSYFQLFSCFANLDCFLNNDILWHTFVTFLQCDATQSAVMPQYVVCLSLCHSMSSVCPSVRPLVCLWRSGTVIT